MGADLPTLLLWGDTQVGKTTFLTTALGLCVDELAAIDRMKSARALSGLFPDVRKLRTQRLTQPTAVLHIDLEIDLAEGRRVRVRDVQGGITRSVQEQSVAERVEDADVILFLVEWRARDIENQMNAIFGAWNLSERARRGLVFTKVEMHLEEGDPPWQALPHWWNSEEWLRPYEAMLQKFGEAVWPISNYGYDSNTGYPAVILGEFGQELPYRIKPCNVHRPFQWAFEHLRKM